MNQAASSSTPDAAFSLRTLEFGEVLAILRRFLSGPLSEPVLAALRPSTNPVEIGSRFDRVRDALESLRGGPRPSLGALKDPRPILAQLRVEGAACSALEILAVLGVARAARDASQAFAKSPLTALAGLVARLADFRPLVSGLDGKINPDGSLDSSASPELARIRKTIESLRRELRASLERLLRKLGQQGFLQDAVITLRNERFVIPVRAEEKRRVPGVIHGSSSSGATVYLEPLETVPLNNELVELEDREYAEIQRILGVYTEKLRALQPELAAAAEILSELDLAFAKAEFSRAYGACLPEFTEARSLVLREARHPVLEETLAGAGAKPVPVSIELEAPKTMMIVSGPNTGGKTVALKTAGLSVLMAQSSIPVLAGQARLAVFGRVLADIGDQQSIQANLSTFSAHITNIERMVEVAGPDDLVLLDELGSSTDPAEGAPLALALLDEFRARRSMIFVTTHLSRLKGYAAGTPEAVNAAMEFNEATLQPTYRLITGLPGKSSALEIAARLGLRESVLSRARQLLEPADAEAARLLASLHERKFQLEREIAAAGLERRQAQDRASLEQRQFDQERRAKLKELDKRFEETVRGVERRWEAAVGELRAEAEARKAGKRIDRKTAALQQAARQEWDAQVLETLGAPGDPEAPEAAEIAHATAVGDRVRLPDFSTPGTVIALVDDRHLEVEVGRLRIRVSRDQVKVLARPEIARKPALPPGGVRLEGRAPDAPLEINVIGTTAEEARERVDEFLDRAYLAGRFRLRVIHGHGKGILRKALHEMLASHPHVEKFYPAPQNEGGAGATIVELKA